jgi:hypothetical protein
VCVCVCVSAQLLNLGKLLYIEIAWRSCWKPWAVKTLKRILDTLTAVPGIFWSVPNITLMKLVHVKLEVLMTDCEGVALCGSVDRHQHLKATCLQLSGACLSEILVNRKQ